MTDAAQVELIKQVPLILTSVGTLVLGILGFVLQLHNKHTIEEVKHATNSLLDQRVDAAKAEGRLDERHDQRERGGK